MTHGEYGPAYLASIKAHPEWTLRRHAEALGMRWDKRVESKLRAYRTTHALEIAEMLGQPVKDDSAESIRQGTAELVAMTDEEREIYRESCYDYTTPRSTGPRIRDTETGGEEPTDIHDEPRDDVHALEMQVAEYREELRLAKLLIADLMLYGREVAVARRKAGQE